MLIRKPGTILWTYNSLSSFSANLSESSTSLKRKRESARQRACCQNGCQSYATIAGDGRRADESHEQEDHSWPAPPKGQAHPTPYQIFQMEQNATYSKARFYELVKIYHPDRTAPSNTALPKQIKMERYRLIVAANNILSDPGKRSAYDRFGAGWNGRAEVGGRPDWSRSSSAHPSGPFSHNWSPPDESIWRNATWEDWEQYYYRRAKASGKTTDGVRPSNGLYMRNGYFVAMIAAIALIGSTANYNRAQNTGQYWVDHRDAVHDKTAKELRRVKREANGSGQRSEQIEWFVRNREATLGAVGNDPETLRQERVDRLLPEREVCKSEGISSKD